MNTGGFSSADTQNGQLNGSEEQFTKNDSIRITDSPFNLDKEDKGSLMRYEVSPFDSNKPQQQSFAHICDGGPESQADIVIKWGDI